MQAFLRHKKIYWIYLYSDQPGYSHQSEFGLPTLGSICIWSSRLFGCWHSLRLNACMHANYRMDNFRFFYCGGKNMWLSVIHDLDATFIKLTNQIREKIPKSLLSSILVFLFQTTLHNRRVRRGRICGCGCWLSDRWQVPGYSWHVTGDRWQVPCDTWNVTPDTLHMTHDTWHILLNNCDKWSAYYLVISLQFYSHYLPYIVND